MILIYPESLIFVISNKKTKYQAFTLIELLVVVAIIGILAAVGVVAYNGYTNAAKRAKSIQQHKEVIKVITAKWGLCEIQGEDIYWCWGLQDGELNAMK